MDFVSSYDDNCHDRMQDSGLVAQWVPISPAKICDRTGAAIVSAYLSAPLSHYPGLLIRLSFL